MDRRFLQTSLVTGVLAIGLTVPTALPGASATASRPGAPGIGDP